MAAGESDMKAVSEAEKLRELFLSKHAVDIEKGHYDDRDIAKFRSDDHYVESFIRSYETMQNAADRLHESLRFRLEYGINDLTADSFPIEFWENGIVYFHNHDKDNHKILYLNIKLHKKDAQIHFMSKQYFAYLLEVQYRQNPDEPIVVLFDMQGAGLPNVDMEFIKFVISCFKIYYPVMLSYMLMYEMPWLFNAVWKIIKAMLSAEAIARIKFVTKSGIQEYVNKDQLWEHMGGTDKFVYKYDQSYHNRTDNSGLTDTSAGGDNSDIAELDTEGALRKRVTFADQDGTMYKSFSSDNLREVDSNNSNSASSRQISSILGRSRNPRATGRANREDNSFIGRLLTISPDEELVFIMEDDAKESTDSIVLKNTLPYSIAFKVKTTSPEKYRVRPSSGIIKAGNQVEVVINLQQGYQNTVHKDKFLIMAMEIANESGESLAELWKSAQRESIMEHRLRCSCVSNHDSSIVEKGHAVGLRGPVLTELSNKVDTLIECSRNLNRSVQMMLILQSVFLILLVLFAFIYWLFYTSGGTPGEEGFEQCTRQIEENKL